MARNRLIRSATPAALFFWSPRNPAASPPAGWLNETFASQKMSGASIGYCVLQPVQRTAGVRRPLVIYFHGLNASTNAGGNESNTASWYQQLAYPAINGGVVPDHWTLFPNGFNRTMWQRSADGFFDMPRIVWSELLPDFIEKFGIEWDGRIVLTGFSMGAWYVISQALDLPEMSYLSELLGLPVRVVCVNGFGPPAYDSTINRNAPDVLDWWPGMRSDNSVASYLAQTAYARAAVAAARGGVVPIRFGHGANDGLRTTGATLSMALAAVGIAHTRIADIAGAGHNAQQCYTNDGNGVWSFISTGLAL